MTPSASILVVNFNSGPHLRTCIESLKAQTFDNFEVIILDNASSDDSLELSKTAIGNDPRFRVIEESRNLGFAKGNNQAAEHARADWIVTLNPDAFPAPDWLANLLAAARNHAQIVHFGSMQYAALDPGSLDGAGDRYFAAGIPWRDRSTARLDLAKSRGETAFETFSACAAAAMYRADKFREFGGFDERFFCFVEDVELGFRFRLQGHPCLQVTDASVTHIGGGAGGGESDFARFHGTRNMIWCFTKNMPLALLVILSPMLLVAIVMFLLQGLTQGNAVAILRGTAAAISGIGPVWRDRNMTANRRRASFREIACSFDWNPLVYLQSRFR